MLTLVIAVVGTVACLRLVAAARAAPTRDRVARIRCRPTWQLPSRLRAPLVRMLEGAEIRQSPEDVIVLLSALAAAAAMVAFGVAPALAPLALGGVIVGALIGVRLARSRVQRRVVESLPGALEQVAAHLRGGGTVASAVEALAASEGPLAGDFRRIAARTRLGAGLPAALARWPDERAVPEIRSIAGALVVASITGGAAAAAIDGLARSVRDRLGARAEAAALAAQARLSAVVIGAVPVAYLGFSLAVDPHTSAFLVGTGAGRLCLVAGLTLEALGVWWMQRILGSEP